MSVQFTSAPIRRQVGAERRRTESLRNGRGNGRIGKEGLNLSMNQAARVSTVAIGGAKATANTLPLSFNSTSNLEASGNSIKDSTEDLA